MRIEIEAFDLIQNFRVDRNPHASGDRLIRATGDGEARAEAAFDGADGVYDLELDYFDETDGVSDVAIQVNGRTVAAWEFDRDLGSRLVNRDTLTSRTVEDVRLEDGDTIALIGRGDGGEPLRIDALGLAFDGF